ncbi:hypothetical protein RJ639_031831 [Escallonia herrerae]|uniref:DUF1771 domain-containing protein n=1 Tax=Escallonia herrerae TaxID=1293975 RepID=A0AA88XFZ2_9ASTE|nr:hypothetical protein RJ639_031831 [Escallonia herrerae]
MFAARTGFMAADSINISNLLVLLLIPGHWGYWKQMKTRMKMEVLHSGISYSNDDKRNLEQLLETFGSMVSLEDIASAYCQAGRDVYMAGEILCKPHRSISSNSTSAFNDELEDGSASSDGPSDNVPGKSYLDSNSSLTRSKMRSASTGVVSGVIGREYANPKPSTNDAHGTTKPLKLKSSDFPTSGIWGEEVAPDAAVRSETMHKDVEDFLFTMLGDGFRLNINSMEKLLDISAFTLEKSDDVLSIAAQKSIENLQVAETLSSSEKLKHGHTAGSSNASFVARSESGVPKRDRDRYNLQKEVLESLFSVPGRVQEAPKRNLPVREGSRTRFGQVVTEPIIDIPTIRRTVTVTSQVSEDEIEDSFEELRKAVKEYWVTMKEYYEAAIIAFAEGDQARAYKLLGEGQFFMNKAREADEKSAQKLLERRNDEDVMSLDLLDHKPREALRLVKFHLTSLCGIPSISYLKLVVGTHENDTKEEARKRLIVKLLEKYSIKWTEERSGQIMVSKPTTKLRQKRTALHKNNEQIIIIPFQFTSLLIPVARRTLRLHDTGPRGSPEIFGDMGRAKPCKEDGTYLFLLAMPPVVKHDSEPNVISGGAYCAVPWCSSESWQNERMMVSIDISTTAKKRVATT